MGIIIVLFVVSKLRLNIKNNLEDFMEKIDTIGNFIIFKEKNQFETIYHVKYHPRHNQFYSWQFLNDHKQAKEFAQQKTKIDKKLFRR